MVVFKALATSNFAMLSDVSARVDRHFSLQLIRQLDERSLSSSLRTARDRADKRQRKTSRETRGEKNRDVKDGQIDRSFLILWVVVHGRS